MTNGRIILSNEDLNFRLDADKTTRILIYLPGEDLAVVGIRLDRDGVRMWKKDMTTIFEEESCR